MMTLTGFFTKLLNFNSRASFNIVFLILSMSLIVFVPQIRELTLLYAVLFLLTEAFQDGVQADRTSFWKGLTLFSIFTFASVLLFSSLSGLITPEKYFGISEVGLLGVASYFLFVAVVEEEVFRKILPSVMGNYIIPQLIYVGFHFMTISYLVGGTATLGVLLPFFIFTFLFACVMMFLVYYFKSTVPAIAVHWIYDLYKVGVLMSIFGWLI